MWIKKYQYKLVKNVQLNMIRDFPKRSSHTAGLTYGRPYISLTSYKFILPFLI